MTVKLEQIVPEQGGLVDAAYEHLGLHVPRDKDPLHLGILLAGAHKEAHAVAAGHQVVGDDDLVRLLAKGEIGLPGRARGGDVKMGAQGRGERLKDRLLVVDDKNGVLGHRRLGIGWIHADTENVSLHWVGKYKPRERR